MKTVISTSKHFIPQIRLDATNQCAVESANLLLSIGMMGGLVAMWDESKSESYTYIMVSNPARQNETEISAIVAITMDGNSRYGLLLRVRVLRELHKKLRDIFSSWFGRIGCSICTELLLWIEKVVLYVVAEGGGVGWGLSDLWKGKVWDRFYRVWERTH